MIEGVRCTKVNRSRSGGGIHIELSSSGNTSFAAGHVIGSLIFAIVGDPSLGSEH